MPEKSFHIITFGCQMNARDSQWLSAILKKRGFRETAAEDADFILLNTCSVREKPQKKIESSLRRIEALPARDRIIGVMGCVAKQEGEKLLNLNGAIRLVAGGDNITEVPAALESLAAGRTGPILALEVSDEYREREFDPEKGASAYVNIMSGCDNFCAYCIVPFTRGRQKSRRMADILEECRKRLEEGAREIILLGQNVNAWGKDLFSGETFASLLDRIAVYKDLERLRFVSVHPADMDDECVEMFAKWEKICPRLHLPLQSGSNRVLKKMRRRYTAEEYMRLVEKLRSARPDLALSTDLIVGFPGETEEDFRETLDIMKKSAFLASYSFCYSDRPGVRASLMPDKIPDEIKGDRLIRLQALQEEIGQELLRLRTGGETEALIEARSPRQVAGKISWQGRDPYGVAIHLELSDPNPAGKVVRVRITAAKKHSLIGEPVN